MKVCVQCGTTYDDQLDVCPHDSASLTVIATDSDPLLGRQLAGRYLLIEKIGQGGMGAVYKALHTRMDRLCAIKVLPPFVRDDPSAAARFQREAKLASRINEPHAVTIYDFGEAEDRLLYLAMEYIDGRLLSHAMRQTSNWGMERVSHITQQIARALAAAHKLGIVHRDLKPDNVMLTDKEDDIDYIKVLDFGIAKVMADATADNLTSSDHIIGTPLYMSPEQVQGEKLDARSDIYSLALMVYEMLSGRLPFEGENRQSLMIQRIMIEPIPLRATAPWISESVERVVMNGLARDRETRPHSAREFAVQLSAAFQPGADDSRPNDARGAADQAVTIRADRTTIKAPRPPGAEVTNVIRPSHTPPLIESTAALPSNTARRLSWKDYAGNWKVFAAAVVVMLALVGAPFALKAMRAKPPAPVAEETPPTDNPNPISPERTSSVANSTAIAPTTNASIATADIGAGKTNASANANNARATRRPPRNENTPQTTTAEGQELQPEKTSPPPAATPPVVAPPAQATSPHGVNASAQGNKNGEKKKGPYGGFFKKIFGGGDKKKADNRNNNPASNNTP